MAARQAIAALATLALAAACTPQRAPAPAPWATGAPEALVGRIWDAAAARFVERATLLARLAEADYVLLGERHDAPQHHRLQAAIVEALAARGRRPAVAFEMMRADRARALARVLAGPAPTAAAVRAAVAPDPGWDWSLYAPIVEAALAARLPIVAADAPPATLAAARARGLDGLPAGERARLGLDRVALSAGEHAALADAIRASHCGMAPEAAIAGLVAAQRVRDASLARALVDGAAGGDGALLIAGAEHVRRDAAVPRYLAHWEPGAAVVSVAFVEVVEERTDPPGAAAFDYAWLTAPVAREDPCERFREQLERLR